MGIGTGLARATGPDIGRAERGGEDETVGTPADEATVAVCGDDLESGCPPAVEPGPHLDLSGRDVIGGQICRLEGRHP
jgi:hypothetical protein